MRIVAILSISMILSTVSGLAPVAAADMGNDMFKKSGAFKVPAWFKTSTGSALGTSSVRAIIPVQTKSINSRPQIGSAAGWLGALSDKPAASVVSTPWSPDWSYKAPMQEPTGGFWTLPLGQPSLSLGGGYFGTQPLLPFGTAVQVLAPAIPSTSNVPYESSRSVPRPEPSYYESPSPTITMPVEPIKSSGDYWGGSGNPFSKDINKTPW